MFEYKVGNIFSEYSEAIVNTVNCVGVMGRGIALQFKKRYPDNYKSYAEACKQKDVQPGKMFVFETGCLTNPRYIINFPTKRHWKGKSIIQDIEDGLNDLVNVIEQRKIKSIAIPPLGSGLGGLNWDNVKLLIEQKLRHLSDVKIIIFEPNPNYVDIQINPSKKVPNMTPGRAALVALFHQYLKGLLDPFVTLLELQKLLYFMQISGENLKLKFVKANFGPYAENLRHVLNAVEGHLITGYEDGGDKPDKKLELVPNAIENAQEYLKSQKDTLKNIAKVTDLVDGFESPFGLELLSTVHWVLTKNNANSLDELTKQVYEWNNRKKQFTKRQINIAMEILVEKGWYRHSELWN
jgi:O-acetyl-ADP-ribose deacetylase (regulator of RNase III)